MVNNKNELYEKINLKDHLILINYIKELNDFEEINLDEIEFDEKKYSIRKYKDDFIFKCSDGRLMNVKFDCIEHGGLNYLPLSVISINYLTPDFIIKYVSKLDRRKFFFLDDEKELSLEEYTDNAFFSIKKNGYIKKLIVKELKDGIVYQGFESIDDKDYLDPKIIYFGNSILYDGVRIDNDTMEITELNGKKIPQYSTLLSFDANEEIKKLESTVSSETFHPITLEMLEKFKEDLLKRKDFINEVIELSDIYKQKVSYLSECSEKFISGVDEYTFKSSEIEFLINSLNHLKNKNSKALIFRNKNGSESNKYL